MRTLLKIVWRNVWRNKRRTLITISSIFFAVVLEIFYRSFMVGFLDKIISDTVSVSCGYIQIHHAGYWQDKSVDSSFMENAELYKILNHEKEVTTWTPRLESFALASSGERTKGIEIMGINPVKENSVSKLSQKLISGNYLNDSDKSILLSEGLAKSLNLKLHDTVVLLGQGYEGNMAAGKYAIKGIVKLAVPEMNNGLAWLPLHSDRNFLGMDARCTSISIMIRDNRKLDAVKLSIVKQTAGLDCEVMTWKQMIPELNQFFQLEMAGDYGIMAGILYLVIAFGIFGTILMMLNERLHEFGILIALGMKKILLSVEVMMEMVLLSTIGTILGMIGAIPIVFYFRQHPIHLAGDVGIMAKQFNFEPIIQMNINFSNFIIQGYIVLSIAILLSSYAIFKINKIKVIEAINN